MIKTYKPTEHIEQPPIKVFLAGSIDMGAAEDWQAAITQKLNDMFAESNTKVEVFNPRRSEWDSSWEQKFSFDPFRNQVEWELHHLTTSDVVYFHFSSGSLSPITLMEYGITVQTQEQDIVMYCSDDFYRKGNIEVAHNFFGRFDEEIHNNADRATENLIDLILYKWRRAVKFNKNTV